jgi:hypothetical protein
VVVDAGPQALPDELDFTGLVAHCVRSIARIELEGTDFHDSARFDLESGVERATRRINLSTVQQSAQVVQGVVGEQVGELYEAVAAECAVEPSEHQRLPVLGIFGTGKRIIRRWITNGTSC